MENSTLPISRASALLVGSPKFFTGLPCANGHVAERRVNGWGCIQCERDRDSQKRIKQGKAPRVFSKSLTEAEQKGRVKAYSKAAYLKNKDVVNARARKFILEHPELVRGYRLKCLYGITTEVYDALVESQGGVCAICKAPPSEKKNHPLLYVDHNHITKEVRGLLCRDCNSALGLFQDSPDVLKNAISYLSSF